MIYIPDYIIIEQIDSRSKTIIYRAETKKGQTSVILKTLKEDYPNLKDIAQIKQEYEIAKNLDIAGIVRPLELIKYNHGLAIVLEDFGGDSLDKLMTYRRNIEVNEFLLIAIQLAESIAILHQNILFIKI
ncbi:MAG: protein kinase [Calothrix sp. SM1_7_51]|nr:protein kinase [Calothrix sp. SM1_7_51]